MIKQVLIALSVILLCTDSSSGQNAQIRKIDGSTIASGEIDLVVERLTKTPDLFFREQNYTSHNPLKT